MASDPQRILIVDDEPSIRKVLAAHLTKLGHEVDTAAGGEEALDALAGAPFDLVVTDLKMPGLDGMAVLAWVRQNLPEVPVLILTAHGTVDSAVDALKNGAFDYITKPFEQGELYAAIAKALATHARARNRWSSEAADNQALVGSTKGMREVLRLIERVAASPTAVLITGETGTGKELVARAIHDRSARRSRPFIQVNCGAIPEGLFDSELFGGDLGVGGARPKPGKLELANGGTLFLEEIGILSRESQGRLLRVLQERRAERAGGGEIDVDVRVIAASDVDLLQSVREGGFREELYYRLNVIPLHLPPLRDRPEDIALLAEHFRLRFNATLGRRVEPLSAEVLSILESYHWPGNIRELENWMERSVLLAEGDVLRSEALRAWRPSTSRAGDELDLKAYLRVHTARLERARIEAALEHEEGNVTRAARVLGISRKSLQTKMKDYGLRERAGG